MAVYYDYYNAPIELWRGVFENPFETKANVLCYQLESHKQALGDDISYSEIEKRMNVNFNNLTTSAANGRRLHKEKYCGVMFGISRNQFWNMYDDGNTPTQWELLKALCYMSLKSIAGNKKIARTNNKMMFARMAGFPTVDAFAQWERQNPMKKTKKAIAPDDIRKYFTRYYAEKLRREVEMEYDTFKHYATHVRGFVFTFDKDTTLVDIIEHAKANTAQGKLIQYKLERNKAEKEALERLIVNTSTK